MSNINQTIKGIFDLETDEKLNAYILDLLCDDSPDQLRTIASMLVRVADEKGKLRNKDFADGSSLHLGQVSDYNPSSLGRELNQNQAPKGDV